jgi:hypothetical protein
MKRVIYIVMTLLSMVRVQAEELHVCTYANCLVDSVYYLMDSCHQKSILPTVLGYGEPFSFKYKVEKIRNYLETLPENDVVLFVDAFDVMIIKTKEELLSDFLALQAPFVIAAEKNCYPFRELKEKYAQSASPFGYLNSGGYIGYVWAVKKTLARLLDLCVSRPYPYQNEDDQGLFTRDYLEHPDEYHLDRESKIFLCLAKVTDDEVVIDPKTGVFCVPTGSYPGILHANSSSFRLLNKAYIELCPHDGDLPWKFVIQVENEVKPKFISWKKLIKKFLTKMTPAKKSEI